MDMDDLYIALPWELLYSIFKEDLKEEHNIVKKNLKNEYFSLLIIKDGEKKRNKQSTSWKSLHVFSFFFLFFFFYKKPVYKKL